MSTREQSANLQNGVHERAGLWKKEKAGDVECPLFLQNLPMRETS